MAAAKGMAAALGCPVSSISALDAMAWRHRHWPGPVLPLLDARKNRFYGALYFKGNRLGDYVDLAAPNFLPMIDAAWQPEFLDHPILVTGPDAGLLINRLQEIPEAAEASALRRFLLDPGARKGWGLELAELGWQAIQAEKWDAADAGPEYVRSSDAELGIISKNP
jgi:tRNA threonylcarbamoyladenosine biosynthesis protein TsaB